MLPVLGVWSALRAQDRMLPSADGAALVQSINVPTNLYTGTANVQIPLCSLETLGGPTIDVGLSYQASGIKMEDRETSVGLGWQLSGGGMITRVVRGRPDELGYNFPETQYSHGRYLANKNYVLTRSSFERLAERDISRAEMDWNYKVDSELANMIEKTGRDPGPDPAQDDREKKAQYLLQSNWLSNSKYYYERNLENIKGERTVKKFYFDAEPDLYYFQTPTCSGTFVIDYNGELCLMPYQDIVVSIKKDSANNQYFEIIDSNGIKYQFDSTLTLNDTQYISKTDGEETDSATYTSTWLLKDMAVNNKVIAKFEYDKTGYKRDQTSSNTVILYRKHWELTEEKRNTYTTLVSNRVHDLKKITTDYGEVLFDYLYRANLRFVEQIEVRNVGTGGFKRFYNINYLSLSDGRVTIDNIKVGLQRYSPIKLFAKFEYHDLKINFANDKKYVDAWGYYNGPSSETTERSESTTYVDMNARDIKTKRVSFYTYDRNPKIKFAVHGALKSITYPTGSYKTFEYESHYGVISYIPIGGLRIKSLSEYEPASKSLNTIRYSYKGESLFNGPPKYHILLGCDSYYNGVETVYFSVSERPIYNSLDFAGNTMTYPTVTETFPDGSYKTYTYISQTNDIFRDVEGMWKRIDGVNSWSSDITMVTPITTKFWARGMIKEAKGYIADGSLVSHVKYTYEAQPQKKVVTAEVTRHFLPLKDMMLGENAQPQQYIGRYQWISRPVQLTKVESVATDYSLPSTTTYVYDEKHPTLVKESTTTDAEGKSVTTTVKYPFNYGGSATMFFDDQSAAMYILRENNALSTPVETIKYNSDGKVLSAEYNSFKTIGSGSVVLDQKMSLRHQQPLKSNFKESSGISSISHSPLYRTDVRYYEYTDKLQPSIFKNGEGPISAILYDSGGLYPVATFSNAYSLQDLQNGNKITYIDRISYSTSVPVKWSGSELQVSYTEVKSNGSGKVQRRFLHNPSSDGTSVSISVPSGCYVTDLVIAPVNATWLTNTIVPGVGKTSETDANGVSVYYEYDSWGRLTKVLDNDRQVTESYEYNTKN
jgi:YD repeat-containing protein